MISSRSLLNNNSKKRLIEGTDPNVDKLVSHEINNSVRFNGENIVYCDADGNIACDRGLTSLLSTFSVGYKRPTKADIKECCARSGEKIIPPRKDLIRVGDSWNKVTMMESDTNKSGRKLGTLVHNQLCLYARSKDEEEFHNLCPKPHGYTRRAIKRLTDSGIMVFFAEFAIVDPMVRYVTPIDLVGVNPQGKLTLVEVKTGYDNIFTIGKVSLKKPFEAWVNSPLNQARLQLLLPCLTLKYQYGVNVDSAWILNINSEQEKLYPLLKGMTTKSDVLYNYLIDTCGIRAAITCGRAAYRKNKQTVQLSKKVSGKSDNKRRRRRRYNSKRKGKRS